MARRIYIKDGGLNTSSTIPPGYTAIGTDSGLLKIKVSDTISDSSKTRVDVVSFGLKQGKIYDADKAETNGLNNNTNIRTLLWEIVNSTGTKLITDTGIPESNTFISTINTYVIDQNIDITVRGYYYIDDSKEKFRLVGKNAAYWSLVGLYNYGRMNGGRTIQPEVIGQDIITTLQESGLPIGASGEGLIFTSQKSRSFGRPTVNPIEFSSFSEKKIFNYYGIDSGDVPVPLLGETITGYQWGHYGELSPVLSQYIECSRNGVVHPIVEYRDLQKRPMSLVEFSRITVNTINYPQPNGLRVWLVKPVGQDTILLSNNIDIQEDDEVFVIPERTGSIPYLWNVDIYSRIDDQGLGTDLFGVLGVKTARDRFGNIRAEDINFNKEYVRNKESIKYRVAYGKDGVYSVSQDYFKFIGNGRYIYALVNREH